MSAPSRDNDAWSRDGTRQRRRLSWRSLTGIAAGAAAAIFLAVPLYFTSSPERCASCHEMRQYYDSWSTSSHRAAASSCGACHVKPGPLNFVVYEVMFYREILGHLAGVQVTRSGPNIPSIAACERSACHSLNREASYSGDLKINHRLHVIDEMIECRVCHPGVVHEGVAGLQKLPPTSLCQECHASDMDRCGYCHADKSLPESPTPH